MIFISTLIIFLILFISIEYKYYRWCIRQKHKYSTNENIKNFWINNKRIILYLFLLSLLLAITNDILYKFLIR